MRDSGFRRLIAASIIVLTGCGGSAGTTAPASGAVTFTKDVAPILYTRCAICHRPGEVAPFSLLTYQDTRSRAKLIADVTARRYMPPWLPEPGYGEFADARRLTDEEIGRIRRWVDQGAAEGDPRDLPSAPSWPDGWQLGQPDLVVTMAQPYAVTADGPDVFRKFVMPIRVVGTRFVRAVEFRPGNARVLHHAIMHLDRTGASRRLDLADPEPGFGGMIFTEGDVPDGHFLGWSPGRRPAPYPEGMAWRLDEGTDLLLQLHLQPSGKPETIQSSVGFFFTDQPPTRAPLGLQLSSYTIDIPPGEKSYRVEDSYVLPADVEVHAIHPHAHYLGKQVRVFALLPDGSRRWLIWIRNWDFYWQGEYRFASPVILPRGSRLVSEYTYDNSVENPRNPSQPPRRVVYGGQSYDEMANTWLQVVPRSPGERSALAADYERKAATRYIAGYLAMLESSPDDPAIHRGLGFAYLQAGRVPEGIAHLQRSFAGGPGDAPAHYNLGNAYAAQGRIADAARHFRRAIELDPTFAEAYNNLGVVLQAQGRFDEADRLYRRALEVKPSYAEAHNNLGVMLQARGDLAAAIRHFREALRIQPDYAKARENLAAALKDKR